MTEQPQALPPASEADHGPISPLADAQDVVNHLSQALLSVGISMVSLRAVQRRGFPEVRGDAWVEALEKLSIWLEERTPDELPLKTDGSGPWQTAARLATALERVGAGWDQVRVECNETAPEAMLVAFWARTEAVQALAVFIEEHR